MIISKLAERRANTDFRWWELSNKAGHMVTIWVKNIKLLTISQLTILCFIAFMRCCQTSSCKVYASAVLSKSFVSQINWKKLKKKQKRPGSTKVLYETTVVVQYLTQILSWRRKTFWIDFGSWPCSQGMEIGYFIWLSSLLLHFLYLHFFFTFSDRDQRWTKG